jgi:NAD(P)-dependent dehydrogenase (short-subunit alcohol dehydrogenase family)
MLENHIALVTGASRGIGQATAIELGRRGAHVILTARTEGGLEETDDAIRAAGGTASIIPLDLMDGPAMDMLGPTLFQRFGRVDIMVHAAGVLGALTPVGHITPKDWDNVVGVNMTATWRLIRTMDPVLRHSQGRAVFITDSRARQPWAYWGAYGATKAAMEHLVLTWAHEMQTMGVTISLFDPGPTRTRLRAHAFPGEPPASVQPPSAVAPAIADLCLPTTALAS